MADRFSTLAVMRVSCAVFLLAVAGWPVVGQVEAPWLVIGGLTLIHVLSGLSTAGVNLASGTVAMELAERCPELLTLDTRDLHPTSWFAVTWVPVYRCGRRAAAPGRTMARGACMRMVEAWSATARLLPNPAPAECWVVDLAVAMPPPTMGCAPARRPHALVPSANCACAPPTPPQPQPHPHLAGSPPSRTPRRRATCRPTS